MEQICFLLPRRVQHQGAMRSPLFLALVALGLLLVAMETARPRYFLHDDNASWFAGAYLHDYRVLAGTGRLAEVNWYQHGGEPFLQQGQTAVLYPPVYLGVALAKFASRDFIWAIDWVAALHLAFGLVGFYVWMRQAKLAPLFAALGALAWVVNPFVLIIGTSWIFTIIVAAWLPWLFWAFDALLARPSARTALYLGGSAGLLFLQGYVQWFAYAMVFLAFYAVFQFTTQPHARRAIVFYYSGIAILIGAGLAMPLLLPMIHATAESALRAHPLPVADALSYAVDPQWILPVQFGFFDHYLVMGTSVVALYCPALLLLPVIVFRIFRADAPTQRTLFVWTTVGLFALILSTYAHALLTLLPVFDKFRWPFKVFLFVDLFFVAALAHTTSSWADARFPSARWARLSAMASLIVVVLASAAVSVTFHDRDFISATVLPASTSPLPSGMDPRLGRVATFSDDLADPTAYRFLSDAYATWYAFPSIGGYDPLVSQQQIEFSLYLDYPNFCRGVTTPDFQKDFENRAVRYWIVDARSSQLATLPSLPGMKLIDHDEERFIFEDANASPIAFAAATPTLACPVTYSGNSMLIPIHNIDSALKVSAGPTDGWWYRSDRRPWQRPTAEDGWLTLRPDASARQVEVTYFDPRFRQGLFFSALLWTAAALLTFGGRNWNKESSSHQLSPRSGQS